MADTYAVVWVEADDPVRLGRLELLADGFQLIADDDAHGRVVRGDEVTEVRPASAAGERLRDMKTVVVSRGTAEPIRIAAVNGISDAFEIAEVLGQLHHGTRGFQSVIVRVPIRPERLADVRKLVAQGPPFQPEAIPGLRRHDVFVGPDEVTFLFQGRDVRVAVDQLARNPAIWKAALQWRTCVAGRPIVLDSGYSWSLDS
jgi:hypothetical protein